MFEIIDCSNSTKKLEKNRLVKIRRNGFNLLIKMHIQNDDKRLRQFLRLNKSQFNFIFRLVSEDFKTKSTIHKIPIYLEEKLAVTLRCYNCF